MCHNRLSASAFSVSCCEGRDPSEGEPLTSGLRCPGNHPFEGEGAHSQALGLGSVLETRLYEARLKTEVAVINTDIWMGAFDLKQAFRHIPGIDRLTIAYRGNGNQVIQIGDQQVEVGPMATNDDIEQALGNPFIRTEIVSVSTIDRIKQKALQARNVAPNALKQFEADLDSIIAEESVIDQKRTAAVTPHQEAISGIKGELDGLKSAIDILSNGEPS